MVCHIHYLITPLHYLQPLSDHAICHQLSLLAALNQNKTTLVERNAFVKSLKNLKGFRNNKIIVSKINVGNKRTETHVCLDKV